MAFKCIVEQHLKKKFYWKVQFSIGMAFKYNGEQHLKHFFQLENIQLLLNLMILVLVSNNMVPYIYL